VDASRDYRNFLSPFLIFAMNRLNREGLQGWLSVDIWT